MNSYIFTLGLASFLFAIASYVCGVSAVIRRSAHPSIISRFFWLLLSITNLLSYIKIGAGNGIYLAIANSCGSTCIFILSLRYGYIEFKRSDLITIVGACTALLLYLFVPFKIIALSAGLFTHFISGLPTYKRVWNYPSAEDLAFWSLFAIASACSLLSVIMQDKNIVYPLYFLLFDAGMTALILFKRMTTDE